MARVRKTTDQKLSELEAKKDSASGKIDKFKGEISKLDSSISALQDSEKQKELENLLETIKKSGKSPEEVLAALKNNM